MHNLQFYRLPNGNYQIRFFPNVRHDSKPSPKPLYIDTPFVSDSVSKFDDFGNEEPVYIRVPLQKDPILQKEESIRCSTSRTRKMIRLLALSTDKWKFFATFTFSMLEVGNRYDYDNVCQYMQLYLSELRRRFPDMKYIVVPEMHKDGAFHFHGLFTHMHVSYAGFYHHQHVYHDDSFTYGFSDITYIKDQLRVSHYLCKYITKDLCCVTPGKKRYWHTKSTLKPLEVHKVQHVIDLMLFKEFIRNRKILEHAFYYGIISYIDVSMCSADFNLFMNWLNDFYYDSELQAGHKLFDS